MASLSKNLIALLHYGGVPKNFFLSLLSEALEKQLAILYKPKAAIRGNVPDFFQYRVWTFLLTVIHSLFTESR